MENTKTGIRCLLSILLLVGVYSETGIFTTIFFALLVVVGEARAYAAKLSRKNSAIDIFLSELKTDASRTEQFKRFTA